MNIREQLLKEHSKSNSLLIYKYIGDDGSRFRELFELFLSDEYRVTQRAAMAVSACFDNNPNLLEPFKKELIANLLTHDSNVAVKRNSIRILQFMEIPEAYKARLFDYCLGKLYQEEETIAVKAFAMQVAFNLVKDFNELKEELKEAIHFNLEHAASAGVKARGKNILKQLQKL